MLLEPQRTNKESNSEYLATYSNSVIRLANDTTSPEGLVNANKIVEASATARHEIYSDTISFGGNTHIVSFFGKADERRYVSCFLAGNPSYGGATFDLQDGVVSATSGGSTTNVEDYGNGWYRCSFSVDHPSTTQLYICMRTIGTDVNVQTYAGDGTSGFHMWGLQVEEGSYATSYIPTYGSAVTRNQDKSYKSGISDLIGDDTTIFVEFIAKDQDSYCDIVAIDGGSEIIELQQRTDNGLNAILYRGGFVANIPATSALITGQTYKAAFRIKSNDFALYLNGTLQGSSTSGTYNSDSIRLNLSGYGASTYNSGSVELSSCLLFNTALSNEELATLTTI